MNASMFLYVVKSFQLELYNARLGLTGKLALKKHLIVVFLWVITLYKLSNCMLQQNF